MSLSNFNFHLFVLRIFISLFLLNSCKDTAEYEKQESVVDISTPNFMLSYGLYSLNKKHQLTFSIVDSIAQTHLTDYTKFATRNKRRNKKGYFIESKTNLKGILSPPNESYLKHYGKGLNTDQKSLLKNSNGMVIITFYGNNNSIVEEQNRITRFLNLLISDNNTILVDLGTIEYFNKKTWQKRRVAPFYAKPVDIMTQVLVKVDSTKGNLCRVTTFGMEKFCLPDITISSISCASSSTYVDLIMGVAQTLSENRTTHKDSTLELHLSNLKNKTWKTYFSQNKFKSITKTTVQLSNTPPKIGDKNNLQLALEFKDNKIKNALNLIALKKSDLRFSTQKKALIDLSNKAKSELPEVKQKFHEHELPDDFLLLKAPFVSKKVKEWIWVEVLEWNDETIKGKLYSSSTYTSHLTKGVIVRIDQNEVFDYIYKNKDGEFIGNKTEEFLDR